MNIEVLILLFKFCVQGKLRLCVQMNKEALSTDFSFLLPLYHTSLQYRKLNIQDIELECLNLLVTVSDNYYIF